MDDGSRHHHYHYRHRYEAVDRVCRVVAFYRLDRSVFLLLLEGFGVIGLVDSRRGRAMI